MVELSLIDLGGEVDIVLMFSMHRQGKTSRGPRRCRILTNFGSAVFSWSSSPGRALATLQEMKALAPACASSLQVLPSVITLKLAGITDTRPGACLTPVISGSGRQEVQV